MHPTDRPPDEPFTALTTEWAASVAHQLVWLARFHGDGRLVLHECWLDPALALCVRHDRNGVLLGTRFDRLDLDLTTGGPAVGSARQASNVYHALFDTPPVPEWTDQLGYAWWGDAPAAGWPTVASPSRSRTIVPMTRP